MTLKHYSRSALSVALALLAGACHSAGNDPAATPPESVYGAREVARTAPSVEFAGVSAIDVDSRGRILVGDGPQIVVLSPNAQVERRIGREGSGPGEFQHVSAIAALARDSLFVYDPGLRRVTIYAPGAETPAYSTQMSGTMTTVPYWARPAGGGRVVAAFKTAQGDVPGRENGAALPEVLRLLNADGSVARDSILLLRESEVLNIDYAQGRGVLYYPFARRSVFSLSRSGVVYHAWTDSLRFTAHGLDGRRLREFQVPHTPRPVTPQEFDSIVQALAHPPFSEQSVRRALGEVETRTWPAFRWFFVDDRERLWVALTPARGGADVEWIILGAAGEHLGSLRLPERVMLGAVRGNRAYGVARDENDVESIVVYEITSTTDAPAAKAGR